MAKLPQSFDIPVAQIAVVASRGDESLCVPIITVFTRKHRRPLRDEIEAALCSGIIDAMIVAGEPALPNFQDIAIAGA